MKNIKRFKLDPNRELSNMQDTACYNSVGQLKYARAKIIDLFSRNGVDYSTVKDQIAKAEEMAAARSATTLLKVMETTFSPSYRVSAGPDTTLNLTDRRDEILGLFKIAGHQGLDTEKAVEQAYQYSCGKCYEMAAERIGGMIEGKPSIMFVNATETEIHREEKRIMALGQAAGILKTVTQQRMRDESDNREELAKKVRAEKATEARPDISKAIEHHRSGGQMAERAARGAVVALHRR